MQVGRVYLVWLLLFLGLAALTGGMVKRWYGFESSSEAVGLNEAEGIAPPHFHLHTEFWQEGHHQYEGTAAAGSTGGTGGAESLPQIGQVMTVVRIFYFIGFVGATIAVVGVLFRMRGLPDGKGLIASIGVLSLLFVGFASGFFAVGIAGAYNDVLEANYGTSPEIAFYTFGVESEDGVWSEVTSTPRTGWYLSVVGVAALLVGFGTAYLGDVRRARHVLTNDDAAAAERERQQARDAQGIERFRREERP